MKIFEEFENFNLKLSSTNTYFSQIRGLHKKNIDFDVWLPSKNMNLQRGKVWTIDQKRELIISVFIGRYIPDIRVMNIIDRSIEYDNMNDDINQIIDGKQRLTTLIDFYNNKFTIVSDDKEYYYKDLPEKYQNNYKWHKISCQFADEEYDKPFIDDEKIQWFRLINFAGTPQDRKHMDELSKKIDNV